MTSEGAYRVKNHATRVTSSARTATAAMACALVLLSAGCSSSRLTDEWRDPSFRASPMRNVLIVCMKKNAVRRRLWEDGLVAELSDHGVVSMPSYRLFGNALPDTDQIDDAIREKDYDGVLIVTRLQTQTTSRYIPGDVRTVPATRFDRLSRSYYTVYRQVQDSGYVETDKLVRHEIDVWTTTEGGRMVWSGTGEILDPASGQEIRSEITGLIIPELARQAIIPDK